MSVQKLKKGIIDPISLIGVGFLLLTMVVGVSVTNNPAKTFLINSYARVSYEANQRKAERKALREGGKKWQVVDNKTGDARQCYGSECYAISYNTDNNPNNDFELKGEKVVSVEYYEQNEALKRVAEGKLQESDKDILKNLCPDCTSEQAYNLLYTRDKEGYDQVIKNSNVNYALYQIATGSNLENFDNELQATYEEILKGVCENSDKSVCVRQTALNLLKERSSDLYQKSIDIGKQEDKYIALYNYVANDTQTVFKEALNDVCPNCTKEKAISIFKDDYPESYKQIVNDALYRAATGDAIASDIELTKDFCTTGVCSRQNALDELLRRDGNKYFDAIENNLYRAATGNPLPGDTTTPEKALEKLKAQDEEKYQEAVKIKLQNDRMAQKQKAIEVDQAVEKSVENQEKTQELQELADSVGYIDPSFTAANPPDYKKVETEQQPVETKQQDQAVKEGNIPIGYHGYGSIEEAYEGLNKLTFGTFGGYVEAYKPEKVVYTWQAEGYGNLADCIKSKGGRAATSCNTYQMTKEQLTSSVKLGTILTAEGATLLYAAPSAVVATGMGGGSALVASGFTSLGAITTMQQTMNATTAWIEDPYSYDNNATLKENINTFVNNSAIQQTAYAGLSWLNIGTTQKVLDAFNNPASTTAMKHSARLLNSVVTGINLGVDATSVKTECSKEDNTGACYMAIAATVADVGFGVLDFSQGQIVGSKIPDIPTAKVYEQAVQNSLEEISKTPARSLANQPDYSVENLADLSKKIADSKPSTTPPSPTKKSPLAVIWGKMEDAYDGLQKQTKIFGEPDTKISKSVDVKKPAEKPSDNVQKLTVKYSVERDLNSTGNITIKIDGIEFPAKTTQEAEEIILKETGDVVVVKEVNGTLFVEEPEVIKPKTGIAKTWESITGWWKGLTSTENLAGKVPSDKTGVGVEDVTGNVPKTVETEKTTNTTSTSSTKIDFFTKATNAIQNFANDALSILRLPNADNPAGWTLGTYGRQTTNFTADESLDSLVRTIKGVGINDPQLIPTIVADRDIIRAKYGLPSIELRNNDPYEYIQQLTKIAKENSIEIRNTEEISRYLEAYPFAGALHADPARGDLGDFGSTHAIYIKRRDDVLVMAREMDHELIHGLQSNKYPNMPIEIMEYEAYVGTLSNPNNLKDSRLREDFFSFFIGGSSRHWYAQQGLTPEWLPKTNIKESQKVVSIIEIDTPQKTGLAKVWDNIVNSSVGDVLFGKPTIENLDIPSTPTQKTGIAKTWESITSIFQTPKNKQQVANATSSQPTIFKKIQDGISSWWKGLTSTGKFAGKVGNIESRPIKLQKLIDENFQQISAETPEYSKTGLHIPGYLREGDADDYLFGKISAMNVVDTKIIMADEPISVLDVGAAKGGFVRNLKSRYPSAKIYAISAHDYRSSTNPLTGIEYQIGNAENISAIYSKDKFDVITSQVTLTHFTDPLGAISQMYDLLKPGGILMIDRFDIPGISDSVMGLYTHLKNQGYNITMDFDLISNANNTGFTARSIKFLTIIKGPEKLDLPIKYAGLSKNKAIYKPTIHFVPEKITLPKEVTDLFTLKNHRLAGTPTIHFLDFADSKMNEQSLDAWKTTFQQTKQYHIEYAVKNGASENELRELDKIHKKIEDAVYAYYDFENHRLVQIADKVNKELTNTENLAGKVPSNKTGVGVEDVTGTIDTTPPQPGLLARTREVVGNWWKNVSNTKTNNLYGFEIKSLGNQAPWKGDTTSVVYHGSTKPVSVDPKFSGSDEQDGSLTLGEGLYATFDQNVAQNYAKVRSGSGNDGVVNEFLIYRANILDLRDSNNLSKNTELPKEFLQEWIDYLESVKDKRIPQGNSFYEESLQRWWNRYFDHLSEAIKSDRGIDLREHVLWTAGPGGQLAPPWAGAFRDFMISKNIDGIIYLEGGEGTLRGVPDASLVIYNYEKIGTKDDWIQRAKTNTAPGANLFNKIVRGQDGTWFPDLRTSIVDTTTNLANSPIGDVLFGKPVIENLDTSTPPTQTGLLARTREALGNWWKNVSEKIFVKTGKELDERTVQLINEDNVLEAPKAPDYKPQESTESYKKLGLSTTATQKLETDEMVLTKEFPIYESDNVLVTEVEYYNKNSGETETLVAKIAKNQSGIENLEKEYKQMEELKKILVQKNPELAKHILEPKKSISPNGKFEGYLMPVLEETLLDQMKIGIKRPLTNDDIEKLRAVVKIWDEAGIQHRDIYPLNIGLYNLYNNEWVFFDPIHPSTISEVGIVAREIKTSQKTLPDYFADRSLVEEMKSADGSYWVYIVPENNSEALEKMLKTFNLTDDIQPATAEVSPSTQTGLLARTREVVENAVGNLQQRLSGIINITPDEAVRSLPEKFRSGPPVVTVKIPYNNYQQTEDTFIKIMNSAFKTEVGFVGIILGTTVYSHKDAIISYFNEMSHVGYYSPILNTWIVQNPQNGKWYRVDTKEEIPTEKANISYMKSNIFVESNIVYKLFKSQHTVITQDTFESQEWKNIEDNIKNLTLEDPYNINLITQAVFNSLTYSPTSSYLQQPENQNLKYRILDIIFDLYFDKRLEEKIKSNQIVCFDFTSTEQAYLAKLGIYSEYMSADVHDENGELVGSHAFLIIKDKYGKEWVADPTGRTVTILTDYIKNLNLTNIDRHSPMYAFINPESAPEYVIGVEEELKPNAILQFFSNTYRSWRQSEITYQATETVKKVANGMQNTIESETSVNNNKLEISNITKDLTASNLEEMKALAASIGENESYKYDYGSNFCGPFSGQILQQAGLFSGDINDLYMLNPDQDMWRLKKIFPESKFTHIDTLSENMSIGDTNYWKTNPLKTGDFLYLDAGSGDTFEHMLVVDYVDNQGRAYSTTNYTTDGGKTFKVERVLLYDPNNPETGMFYNWTNKDREYRNNYGNTGNGGFLVIRPNEGVYMTSTTENNTDTSSISYPVEYTNESKNISTPINPDWTYSTNSSDQNFLYWNQLNYNNESIPHSERTWANMGCGIMVGAMATNTNPYQYYEVFKENNGNLSSGGSNITEMKKTLEDMGYSIIKINKDDINNWTSAGNPVIVDTNRMFLYGDRVPHFSLAIEVDESGNYVLNDPILGYHQTVSDKNIDKIIDGESSLVLYAVIKD